MDQLRSYLQGGWREGQGDPVTLRNPASEAALAEARPVLGLSEAFAFGRDVGGPALRSMTLEDRGALLKAMAKLLHEHREDLIAVAVANGGNTRGDAKFDIDGGNGVLAVYAELAKGLGEHPWLVDGEAASLTRSGKIRAQHVLVPRRGVAFHINAFNFPAWGMLGKMAVALLAGVPVISKPATSSALLAHRIAEILVESNLLPEGAFQLLVGRAPDMLDHLGPQDVIGFTGSAATGMRIRGHERVLRNSVRVNIEADSLNAVVVGPDVESGTELFDLVIRDCAIELTQKAGQKCTATRRILVANDRLDAIREALIERLDDIAAKTGDPANPDVRMGPLATSSQLRDSREGVETLSRSAKLVRGNPERSEFIGVDPGKGYFLEPILLEATAESAREVDSTFHRHEVFAPVATLLPYDGSMASASEIVAAGEGSLVSTVYSDDRAFVTAAITDLSPYLGRLVVANEKVAGASISPGCVFPQVNHGGPGRAGAGAELGGRHGLEHYLQRTTIQGSASQLARILGSS